MDQTLLQLQEVACLIMYGHLFQDLWSEDVGQFNRISFEDSNHMKVIKDMYPYAIEIDITKLEEHNSKIKATIYDADHLKKVKIIDRIDDLVAILNEYLFDPRFQDNYLYNEELEARRLYRNRPNARFVDQQKDEILKIASEMLGILTPQSLTSYWALRKILPKDIAKEIFQNREQKIISDITNYLARKGIVENTKIYDWIMKKLKPLIRTL